MEFFLKYKRVLFRVFGAVMLLIAFVVHFWQTPKEGISEAQLAAQNIARMEASVASSSSKTTQAKPDASKFIEELKSAQEKQMQYITIFIMMFGVGFLRYSFLRPKDTL